MKMTTIDAISLTGFLLSIIFLSYSAYSDLKIREVSNRVWVIYLPLSVVVLMLKLFLDQRLLTISVISIAATTCLSLIMFYIGIFGGADAKAFICLSVALPTNPFSKSLFLSLNPIFPVMVLYTTYFLSASTIFYVVSRNVTWKYVKRKQLFEKTLESSLS
jgi:Flp pilus assembly protein protease CpaA